MKKYRKIIDGKPVIMSIDKIVVLKDGRQIINPREATVLANGWAPYESPVVEEIDVDEEDRALGELGSSDYKIIKCMEAYLCGEPLPYDIAALHAEREAQRKIINKSEIRHE